MCGCLVEIVFIFNTNLPYQTAFLFKNALPNNYNIIIKNADLLQKLPRL